MRHVGRFDPETGLPITEVTQAEFDALPLLCETVGDEAVPWRSAASGIYGNHAPWRWTFSYRDGFRVRTRRLVIVEDSSPRVPYPSREPGLSLVAD